MTELSHKRLLSCITALVVLLPATVAMPPANAQASVTLRVSFSGPTDISVGTEAVIDATFAATYSSGRHTLSLVVPPGLTVVESEGRCESFDGNASVVYPGRQSFDYITTSRHCTVRVKVRPSHCGRFVLTTEFREVSVGVQRAPLTATHAVYVRRSDVAGVITVPTKPGSTTTVPSPITLIC